MLKPLIDDKLQKLKSIEVAKPIRFNQFGNEFSKQRDFKMR